MVDNSDHTELLQKKYVTLIVRIMLDQQGQLQQGVLVDIADTSIGYFRHVDEIPALIAQWLALWHQNQARDNPLQ